MIHKLVPRFTAGQAEVRLQEIKEHLAAGKPVGSLVSEDLCGAVPNATGGMAASHEDLAKWRRAVIHELRSYPTGTKVQNDLHSIRLGKVLEEVVHPSPSDAASDGVWSYLALIVFPDVVYARWPPAASSGELPKDRWIGKQGGRDRNYLKLAWRRWKIFGLVMEEATIKLGEDEFGALLERSAVARNFRLVQAAAKEILSFSTAEGSRMDFTRELMKQVTYQTGPLNLDILSDVELARIVNDSAYLVLAGRAPRRAAHTKPVKTNLAPTKPTEGSESAEWRNPVGLTVPLGRHYAPAHVKARQAEPPRGEHEFTLSEEPDGKMRMSCTCGFQVRRKISGVSRLEELHRRFPSLSDFELSKL